MAGQNIIDKNLAAFKGLDLRTSDIIRPKENATSVDNAEYRQTGALNKRNGYQYNSGKTDAGYGMTTFRDINTTTGAVTEQLIGIDDNLLKLVPYTFNITYSGSDNATYEIYLKEDTAAGNKFFFKIVDGTTTVLDEDLGNGGEGSPVTVSALVTTINALTDFSAGTISGGGTTPAAFLPITNGTQSVATTPGTTINFSNWEDISLPTGYSTPFSTFLGQITSTDFENATFAQINNVMYIATGHNELHKYDGTRVYRAGMPQATTPTAADAASDAGSFANNRVVRYRIRNKYTDAKGNITYGQISEYVAQTASGTGEAINVTYTELTGAAGWDVDGTLEYEIFRTDDSADATDASLYYLVQTASHGDTIPWKDTGATEGIEYIPPIKTITVPPKCRYIDSWRGQLIMAGDLTSVDTVYYSDITNGESFPSDNSFIVDNKVTGMRALDTVLYVFEENAIRGVTGDLGVDNFQVDPVSREGIGATSHHSIQEVRGSLFFLSDRGVYTIQPGQPRPEFIGEPVSPEFSKNTAFTFKQSVGYTWQENDKYILFMPVVASGASYSDNDRERVYVYDYYRGAWLKWSNYNFMGGISDYNGDIYFSRRINGERQCCRVSQLGADVDYADHNSAISFSYKTHWETLGEPSQWKKFLRLKIHSYDITIDDFESDIFDITLSQEVDWDASITTQVAVMDFSGGISGWGADPWGQFPWGMKRLRQLKRKLLSRKCKSARFIFANANLHQNILISGYELQIAAPYANYMKE